MTGKGDKSAPLQARIDELEAQLARSERSVQALREVGLALGSTLDLDQLLELILQKITDLLEGDRATLYLLDEQRGKLFSRIMVGNEARSIELPIGEGIEAYAAGTKPIPDPETIRRDLPIGVPAASHSGAAQRLPDATPQTPPMPAIE